MRNVIRDAKPAHDHLGFCHDRTGIVRSQWSDDEYPKKRDAWLRALANAPISDDYARFHHERWRPALTANPNHRAFELELTSRLLIGHGNPSGGEVGLTLHHTWGVPMIPGSAIKGVLAHHVAEHYGDHHEPQRKAWAGVLYDEGRIQAGPGEHYGTMFGAPDSREDPHGARRGKLVFHDALYVPASTPGDRPLARDVLTVHNKTYYDGKGEQPPNDYDDPNPVAFLTVRPGARFYFVIEGPPEWLDLVESLLREVLTESGVGGKTSLGYGRLHHADPRPPATRAPTAPASTPTSTPAPRARATDHASEATMREFKAASNGCDIPAYIELLEAWRERLLAMSETHRRNLVTQIKKKHDKRPRAELQRFIELLSA